MSSDDNVLDEENDAKNQKNSLCPGIYFWIVFDAADFGVPVMEERLVKQFIELGTTVSSCKAIRGRGKSHVSFFNFFIFVFV